VWPLHFSFRNLEVDTLQFRLRLRLLRVRRLKHPQASSSSRKFPEPLPRKCSVL
jgi:hypothetical protein